MPNKTLLTTHSFELSIPDVGTVGYFSECTGLELYFEVHEHPEGGINDRVRRLPGRLGYPNLVLTSGLTNEEALFNWVRQTQSKAEPKEITITLHGHTEVREWTFDAAFPVRWSGPLLTTGAAGVATESIEIVHGGPMGLSSPPSSSETAPIPQNFERATLEIDAGDPIECAFNPSGYTVSKTNVWNFKPTAGIDRPPAEFGGGMPQSASLPLLFDSSLLGPGQSVKNQVDRLFKMMEASGTPGGGTSPSNVVFRWGSVSLPPSVPAELSAEYVLFHANGEPRRANIHLTLLEAEQPVLTQNPTTQAKTGLRVHRVRDGDSLPAIAHDAYGDPTRWRAIAEANGIENPFRLRRGAELTIPGVEA
jgi:phage tail-like protein